MDYTTDEEDPSPSFENCSAFSTSEVCKIANTFLRRLRSHQTDEEMQLNGLEALCQITSDVFSTNNIEDDEQYFGESYWLEDINVAMSCFPNRPDLQETACRCLSAILRERPMLCDFIGDEQEGKLPLHHNVSYVLGNYYNLSEVFQSACNAISIMSSSCEILQQDLIKKNLQKIIMKKIILSEDHEKEEEKTMLTTAFEVLVSLSRGNIEFKRNLLKDDIFACIAHVFEVFASAPRVQEQAIILLATLTNDLEIARQQCLVEEFHFMLLDVLHRYGGEESLMEVTFEALSVICAAEGVPVILRKSDGFRLMLNAMTKHMGSLKIQKKGLVLMQLLVTNHTPPKNAFSSLVSVVKHAMEKFPEDIDIQTEASVCLHLLAEQSSEASVDLIKLNVHEQIFQIFESFPNDADVLNIASECIYLLACKQNLKNTMLRSASALGLLKAVECLIQLGADVNYSEDDSTPLCLACRANNLVLVDFLLKQGVADVHSALAFCLSDGHDKVAGFLLKHLGHDEEGGTITLSGLKLSTLKAQWLAPALMGDAACASHVASQEWLGLVEKAGGLRSIRHYLSSSFLTLDDDADSSTGEKKDVPPVLIPRSESRQRSDSRCSQDSVERYQLTGLHFARLRSVSGVSIPYSSNDPRLVTVEESKDDIILPETRNANEAFCFEEGDFVAHPRSRGYSDLTHSISSPMLLKRQSNASNNSSQMSSEGRNMPRSKSNSCIEDKTTPSKYLPKNPVHRLDLSFNEIKDVEILAKGHRSLHLKFVEKLDLSNNKLDAIPGDLNMVMPKLRELVLKHNCLIKIPACVYAWTTLEKLDMSHNEISHRVEKPRFIVASLLSHLDLSNNKIGEFPAWFGDCFRLLTTLDLSYNRLGPIKDQAVHLHKLQSLNVSHNNITVIPPKFLTCMKELECFQASHNDLKCLPDQIAPFLSKLGVAKLSHNKLNEKAPFYLTKFVLLLPNVHTVDLSANDLVSVAAPLNWGTQRLKDLKVSHNKIKSIDLTKGVNSWSSLIRLDLSFNQLRQLPKGVGELKALGQLNVSGNKGIATLPDEMGNLGKLWEFLHSDVKLDMSSSILRGKTRDLVGHLHARLKNSAPFPQRKVVVCGPRGSGKSTLLHLLTASKAIKKLHVQDKRKAKGKMTSENLEVQKWFVNDVKADCRCCARKNVTLILRMWEFPGHKASAHVHRCFLSEASLHVLVYDVSVGVDEVENLKPWLANIHDQCPNSGVILVGTHLDRVPVVRQSSYIQDVAERVKKLHLAPGLPEVKGHFLVSCLQKNSGVGNLARKLINLAMACNTKDNEIHNHKVPKSFIRFQDIIESRADTVNNAGVVDLAFLCKVIQDSKLDIDGEELNEAIVFLRKSGLLVNYAKPGAKLNQLFFLWPAKLAALIAKVVNYINAITNSETIERYNLLNIIVKEGFSDSIVPQILRLFEDFELVLPVSATKYLVQLHSSQKQQPMLPCTGSVLRRRYSMPYFPVGFWRRIVAHLIFYKEKMTDWQRQKINGEKQSATYQYWEKGFSASWSSDCCFTVEIPENAVLDIIVPAHHHGHILLGNLVYHIDTLLKEWFPSLCGTDPLYGHPMIRKTTFCISCQEHQFPLEECVAEAKSADSVECPVEHATMPLRQQVPDILLSHIDQRYLIEERQLQYDPTAAKSLLGKGSFGSVYRAQYRDKNVAAKVFFVEIDDESLNHLEQEVRFLTRLRHPSIIDLIGMCLRPSPIAVLELAPLGSLHDLFHRGKTLSRGIRHRIGMQVSEGLAFLHRHTIVYRDLKPHNILIFSLSLGTLINAKISDFGSSRPATPCGFIASEGTPGYRAPEAVRGDVVYNEKVDIFSLGMLLYELATGGKQPFNDLKFRNELDEAVVSGRPVDPIVVTGTLPWPDMQDLLDHMLEAEPEKRPSADQVYERLSNPEFVCLKSDIAVCKGQAVECMAVRCFTENARVKRQVWIGSGASDWSDMKNRGNNNSEHAHTSQLSRLDLSSTNTEGCKGLILQDGRIMCIASVQDLILVGTQTGKLWVYHAREEKFLHAMPRLPDTVLCLLDNHSRVFAGLANGQLAIYDTSELYDRSTDSRIVGVGDEVCCLGKPMLCMAIAKKKLLCGTGHNIVVFDLDNLNNPEHHWSIAPQSDRHRGLVSNIVVDKQGVWTSTKGSSRIQLWDFTTKELRAFASCENLISGTEPCEESARGMRVVSLLIHKNVLWVGTGCGRILLIDTRSQSLLMTMNRHKSAVRFLATAEIKDSGKPLSVVLSGGLGFVQRESASRELSSRDFGYILVWESGINDEMKELRDYKQKRQEWLMNHINR